MAILILKTYELVSNHINTARSFGDKHKNELGFLPYSAYEEQAARGRLWVAIDSHTNDFLGYLMFGGRYPSLKVTQMFVHPQHRKDNVASELINALVNYGENDHYLSISARVAEDLSANNFWEKVGFKLVLKKAGGKTTNRIINIRTRDLDTPSLLSLMSPKDNKKTTNKNIFHKNKPKQNTPLFTIDLNILFDILKNRASRNEANAVMMAGLNNIVRIAITAEFAKELLRNSHNVHCDPIYEFSKSLPTLRHTSKDKIEEILPSLREIVFPKRSVHNRTAKQDHSDLLHLAYSICNGVDGFITREKAILRASKEIYAQYSLEIVPPSDFIEPIYEEKGREVAIAAVHDNSQIEYSSIRENDLNDLGDFLKKINTSEHFDAELWETETTGDQKQRWCVRNNDKLIGVATWRVPTKIRKTITLHLAVDEEHPLFEKITDHFFEILFKATYSIQTFKIELKIGSGQTRTKALALARGFNQVSNNFEENKPLVKIVCCGIIGTEKWKHFTQEFFSLTDLELPKRMPTYSGEDSNWVTIIDKKDNSEYKMTLFDFEVLVSPGLFLCPQRDGLVIPIQHNYATEIGIVDPTQQSFLPRREVLLHTEKAYFRTSKNLQNYAKDMPIIFYVSGKGEMSQQAVGCARITYSGEHTVNEIETKFSRQGVLSHSELEARASNKGTVHVLTFDNYNQLSKPISYNTLKNSGCISGANLVTAEPQTAQNIQKIISLSEST